MKIIFLDIDGVLNNELFYREEVEERKGHDIDTRNVELLNKLIQETGAKVVVSSTWRLGNTNEKMQNTLEKFGFRGEVIGLTPQLNREYAVRGNEIHKWIKDNFELLNCHAHNFTEYVIFDDDSDMLYWQKDNFICVDGYVGLTPRNIYKAKWILNGRKYENNFIITESYE